MAMSTASSNVKALTSSSHIAASSLPCPSDSTSESAAGSRSSPCSAPASGPGPSSSSLDSSWRLQGETGDTTTPRALYKGALM
eukprot:587946-Pyramimonas_sp.AAC.1